jgi:GAF domain-containing protein
VARDVLDEHRLRRLIDVGRGLVAQLDLEPALREVVAVARELTGARCAALGVLDEDRRELERFICVDFDEGMQAQIGDHLRSNDFPHGRLPLDGLLAAPIVIRGQAYGGLYLGEKGGENFDVVDEEAAAVLAEWAAVAIFNLRIYRQSEEDRGALERAVHALEATTEISRAVGGQTDRAQVLETIAKRTRSAPARCWSCCETGSAAKWSPRWESVASRPWGAT